MDSLCSEDQQEPAVISCICKFPLPAFCPFHEDEHRTKNPNLHFSLPISARQIISSKSDYFQLRPWIFQLSSNCEVLKGEVEEFSHCEDRIEAVYQEICESVEEAKLRIKTEFAELKSKFQTEVWNAIKEIHLHALEKNSFEPETALSKLLWEHDTTYISSHKLYDFHTSCMKDYLPSAFQISGSFTFPGIGQISPVLGPKELMESLASQMKAIEGKNRVEIDVLTAKLQYEERKSEVLRKECVAADQSYSALKSKFEKQASQLESKTQQLSQTLHNLEQHKQRIEDLEQQILEKDKALTTSTKDSVKKELRCVSLKTANDTLNNQLENLTYQLMDIRLSLDKATKELTERRALFKIHMKSLEERTITLVVSKMCTVREVRQMYELVEGTSPQRLIFRGEQLEETKTLGEYNLEADDTIHYALNWRVGNLL